MATLLDITLDRTLDAWVDELRARALPGARVDGWLFEDTPARRNAEARLAQAGIDARFHSAYKPLVFHFLEQVPLAGLQRVTVRYPVHDQAAPRRFALEAYPLAEMLAGIEWQLLPQDAVTPTETGLGYRVALEWRDGRQRTDDVFAPNRLHADPLGQTRLSPTAWLRLQQPDGRVEEGPRDCDHAALLRHALDAVQRHAWPASTPYFERLDLRVDLPCIAHAPDAPGGWIDSREALHEDLYFSLLELFQQRSGRAADDRRLQPGQIVPDVRGSHDGTVRLQVRTSPFAAADDAAAPPGDADTPLARLQGPLSPQRIDAACAAIAGQHFEASSRQGRTVRGVYRAGSGPAVLITAGQHANETSGVVGALRAAQALAARADAHFALIPLENPDGYALHRELCAHAPHQMHHAARYTALGDDLEAREVAPFLEADARRQALALSGATLHLNLHGYPAHEWTRPLNGYLPRGFDMWTLPQGFLLIVRHRPGWAPAARRLAAQICARLAERPRLMAFNARQQAACRAHAGELAFDLVHGTGCRIVEVDRPGPPLTVITEFPDETLRGEDFVLAHDSQRAAALAAVDGLASALAAT